MLDSTSTGSLTLGLRAGTHRTLRALAPVAGRRRRVAGRVLRVLVLALFTLSIAALVVHNRLTPTTAGQRPARIAGAEGELYRINGFDLWVAEAGPLEDPLPIIVLHGGPGQSASALREPFRFLEASHRVIYYDQRGSGLSEVKPSLSHYTVDQLVHELEILRRMVAGRPQIRLVAHGFGGVVAQHYALSYPDNVESMVLFSSLPAEGAQYGSVVEYYEDLVHTLVLAGLPPSEPSEADAWYARYWRANAVAMLGDPSHENLLPDLSGSFGPAHALNASLASSVRRHRLARASLTTRTLLIYGEAETPSGTREGLAPVLLRFSSATLVTLPGTGYWSFLEAPDQVRPLVRSFLSDR